MNRSTARPLLWLAALLAVYLCAPFIASVPQLGAADWPNVDWQAVWSAVGISAASASVASLVILLGGGTKKRQPRDIALAHERWADYKQRKTREK